MFKRLLLLGITSGVLAAVASLIYGKIYTSSLGADFSKIVTVPGIFMSCITGCLLASIGYFFLNKWLKARTDIVFNLLFSIVSFASIVGAIGFKLPLDYESPELFPGLTVPMHFFPVLAWLTVRPLFLASR